jgi:DNA-binding NarL/FixJ family response regulator
MSAGARGYIAKTSTPLELLDAVRTVLAGGHSVTTDMAPAMPSLGGVPGTSLGLTHRQADVLRLLIQGKPNKLICRDLRLSEGTVKVHVSAILKALNVRSRAQAIAELTRRGVVIDASTRNDAH